MHLRRTHRPRLSAFGTGRLYLSKASIASTCVKRELTLRYINRRNVPLCRAYFPAMELVTLPTGHWCQSEKPAEFMQALQAFLERDA